MSSNGRHPQVYDNMPYCRLPTVPTMMSCKMPGNYAIAVSPLLADRDKNNCAEQMHDSHPSSRIRPLDQSEVVRTVGCSCPDRPESGRLQYLKYGMQSFMRARNTCYPVNFDVFSDDHLVARRSVTSRTRHVLQTIRKACRLSIMHLLSILNVNNTIGLFFRSLPTFKREWHQKRPIRERRQVGRGY